MKNSKKLLEKIKSRKIMQKSRLRFVAKNIIFWIIFIFSVIIGGLSFSIILFVITQQQQELSILLRTNYFNVDLFLNFLPFFWIISCIVFLIVSIFGMRHTKTGYRYSRFLIFGASILFSILLGIFLFFAKGAEKIEEVADENMPSYIFIGADKRKMKFWLEPKHGYLGGKIVDIVSKENYLIIENFEEKGWRIDIREINKKQKKSFKKGMHIKIIGKIKEDNFFIAKEIYIIKKPFFKRNQKRRGREKLNLNKPKPEN